MRFYLIAALFLPLAIVACSSASNTSQPNDPTQPKAEATATPDKRPGSPSVYQRIESLTDCSALQAEFDQAEANGKRERAAGNPALAQVTTAYMAAADKRMKSLKCY